MNKNFFFKNHTRITDNKENGRLLLINARGTVDRKGNKSLCLEIASYILSKTVSDIIKITHHNGVLLLFLS